MPETPSDVNENAFKHQFGRVLLKKLAGAIGPHYPAFEATSFVKIAPMLEPLEMKARVRLVRDELRKRLPPQYPRALAILLKSVKSGDLSGFELWPYTEFVQTYGLEDADISLRALRTLTTLFTSEWAVRPFIKQHPEKTLAFLLVCAGDEHDAVRRWASEGSRPRLPWGERLQNFVRDPKPTLPILDALKFDPALFVRTSVANHLNDIAKDHPDYVIRTLTRWRSAAGAADAAKVEWIARRALRTLIKEGHTDALAYIGVSRDAKVSIGQFRVAQRGITVGDRLDFSFSVESQSKKPEKVVLDYAIHFVKANGTSAPKVFKLKTFEIAPGAVAQVRKSHHFRRITTRVFYPGAHFVELQVNGVSRGKLGWKLTIK